MLDLHLAFRTIFHMQRSVAFVSGTLGVALFVLSTIVGGALVPGYSHIGQYISESYALGTAHGPWLRFAGFLPSGLLLMVFAWAAMREFNVSNKYTKAGFAGVGLFYGFGTVLGAFFPCEAGCQADGHHSVSQAIHNISGLLTYLCVPACLVLVGVRFSLRRSTRMLGRSAVFCGIVAMLGFIAFIEFSDTAFRGLVQRVIEGAILLWIIRCSFHLNAVAMNARTPSAAAA